MVVTICLIGAAAGWISKIILDNLSEGLFKDKKKYWTSNNNLAILICMVLFLISFLKIGLNIKFIEASILNCILLIISFIDMEYRIIPDKIIFFLLIIGALFCFLGCISIKNAFLGMLFGGGLIFLLALIPGTIGGGDIKMMFAIGSLLGAYKVIIALFSSFILAAIVSVFLILLKIKGRKDYIPFGPFLSLGSFAIFNFFI